LPRGGYGRAVVLGEVVAERVAAAVCVVGSNQLRLDGLSLSAVNASAHPGRRHSNLVCVPGAAVWLVQVLLAAAATGSAGHTRAFSSHMNAFPSHMNDVAAVHAWAGNIAGRTLVHTVASAKLRAMTPLSSSRYVYPYVGERPVPQPSTRSIVG